MLLKFLGVNVCSIKCAGIRETVEENVVAHIEFNIRNSIVGTDIIVVIEYSRHYPWQHL